MSSWTDAIRHHYEHFWNATSVPCAFGEGPVWQLPADFGVVRLTKAGAALLHIYATLGMSQPDDEERLELFVLSPQESTELVELLYMTAHYHRTGNRLGFGHFVDIGRPWLTGSACDRALISLPYLDGPSLEHGKAAASCFRVGWLIPITAGEAEYRQEHGLDALEDLFEEKQFDYADPLRSSVVEPVG